jgi:RimJ/RimL family protein N-acetyltransferase
LSARGHLILREVADGDADAIFEMMRDPEAVRMAAFTADDPDDRAAFDTHLARVRSAPDNLMFAVEVDGRLVGTAASFTIEGDREVTYWIDRSRWGEGIAGEALRQLLERDPTRPIMARAASANVASIAVLRRNGFVERGREISFAAGAGGMIEETLFTLDAPDRA